MNSVQTFLQNELESNHTPCIQYSFFDKDATWYSFHNGYTDIKLGRKADPDQRFNLFSITKTFTALAVLQLCEAGKLKLNELIQNHLPGIPYTGAITIEQLLTHTAGLPNPLPLRWTHLIADHKEFNRDHFFKNVFEKNRQLKSAPGTRFNYSNLGFVLLGQLIEKVSGKQYEDFINENILEKAQIARQDLGFIIDPAIHARGYQKYWTFINAILGFMLDKKKTMDAREGKWKPFKYFYVNGTPYGGLVGNSRGLVKYAQALLRTPSLLLSEDAKQVLFRENKIGQELTGMCMSWFSGSLNGYRYVAHPGGGGGYYCELRLYPESGYGSVILNNRTGMKNEKLLDLTDRFFLP